MVKSKQIALVAALAVIGIIVALCLRESDTTKVKKQFAKLSELVSKTGEEPLLQMASKAKSIGALFGAECTLSTPIYDFSGKYDRGEIVSNAARWRAQFGSVSLSFADLTVEFPDPQTARAVATASLKGDSAQGGYLNENREVDCSLQKVDGKWLFVNWTVVEVLRK